MVSCMRCIISRWHAGQANEHRRLAALAIDFDDKARGGAHRVENGDGSSRQVGLESIIVAQLAAPAGKNGLDAGQTGVIQHQITVRGKRGCVTRYIVDSWA